MVQQFTGSFTHELDTDETVDASETEINVRSSDGQFGNYMKDDVIKFENSDELLQITAINGDLFTVTRGYGGTTPESHGNNDIRRWVRSGGAQDTESWNLHFDQSDCVEVGLDKDDDGDGTYNPGESFNFRLIFKVTGGTTAAATIASDTVPAEFVVGDVANAPHEGPITCAAVGNSVTCTLPGGVATGNYIAFIPVTVAGDAACHEVENLAHISGEHVGNDPNGDQTVTIECLPTGHIHNVKFVTNIEDDATGFTAPVNNLGNDVDDYLASFSEVLAHVREANAGFYDAIENTPTPGYEYLGTTIGSWDEETYYCPEPRRPIEDDDQSLNIIAGYELVGGGDLVFCHFNEAVGTVIVQKVDSVPGTQDWHFNVHRVVQNSVDESFAITNSGSEVLSPVPLGTYEATEEEARLQVECPDDPGADDYYTTLATPNGTTLTAPGQTITFIFTNQPCPDVEATGILVIEKWNDLDGDGLRDAGEPAIGGWQMTVTGPQFPGGATFATDATGTEATNPNFGKVALPGILAGTYIVTESMQSGWHQTGLLLDGAAQAVSMTIVATVVDDPELDDLETVVAFGNRRLGSIRVTKLVNDQQGTATVAGWTFQLTGGCNGVATSATTGASGVVVFDNLEPTDICGTPYLVSETGANTDGFSVSPSATQMVDVVPAQQSSVTFTNTRGITTFVAPTPTPTTPPTDEPEDPTVTPEPTEDVAGEITPGAQPTPIAPATGTGAVAAHTAPAVLALLLGFAVLSLGGGLLALARKR
jgi:hypothetical protein